jgi:Arc/MetJ-type ribon-helix-helix transcriptional regulator
MSQPETTNPLSSVTVTVTVPADLVARLRAEVRAGETASDRDVVERALIEKDFSYAAEENVEGLEDWLATEAPKLVSRFEQGTLKTYPIEEAFARLEDRILPLRKQQ